jgi:hypothetical protein
LPQLAPPPSPPGAFGETQPEPASFAETQPEPAFASEPDEAEAPLRIDTRRSRRVRSRGEGATGLIVSFLLVAAAGTLAYVAWPKLAPHLGSARRSVARQSVDRAVEQPESADRNPPPAPEQQARPTDRAALADTPRRDSPRVADPVVPEPDRPVPDALKPDAPKPDVPEPIVPRRPAEPPRTPETTMAADRAAVDDAIGAAARALRSEDWAAAGERLDAAEAAAGDDADSIARVTRWRRLLLYAEGFGPLRAQALAAAVGNDYNVDGKAIGIVEANDARFIYRRLGRNVSIPSDEIPRAIVVAIVSQWFAGADRPANHLFLGAFHACREPPNVAQARAAWQRASLGGEADGDRLLSLLDDPALVAAGP